ncbi:seminase-like [Drosophila rhopaloa]|uniref:Peptidase S1 domain-containing protein n=1 Tax=Drosophila rhopaloa TaxID=1041015 RepID=A0ABM5HLH6_DRORH|nr:seminase-like [Drosophila rhopaloa]
MQRPLWIFQILLFVVLANEARSAKTHYHRYMLASYRSQHNPKTQMDYKRRRTGTGMQNNQVAQEEEPVQGEQSEQSEQPAQDVPKPRLRYGTSQEPVVLMTKSQKKVPLHELMVRIYQHNEYICMGTVISEKLVVTTSTCFEDASNDVVTMKMYNNEALDGHRIPLNQTFLKGADPLLVAIELSNPPKNSSVIDDTVKLCSTELENYEPIELPLWIRSRHNIHSQRSFVLPLQECLHRMKDPGAHVATRTMICAKNMKFTSQCQLAIGNPLIHAEMICGINVAGHNCPAFTGVDLYIRIYDALDFSIRGMELIKNSRIEDTIL